MITSNGLLIARISQKDVRSHDVIPEKSIEPNVEKMRESLKKALKMTRKSVRVHLKNAKKVQFLLKVCL